MIAERALAIFPFFGELEAPLQVVSGNSTIIVLERRSVHRDQFETLLLRTARQRNRIIHVRRIVPSVVQTR